MAVSDPKRTFRFGYAHGLLLRLALLRDRPESRLVTFFLVDGQVPGYLALRIAHPESSSSHREAAVDGAHLAA